MLSGMTLQRPWGNVFSETDASAQTHQPLEPRLARWWTELLQTLAATLVALVIGWMAFTGFVQNNDFPSSYHPDEGTKVRQLLDEQGRRNFNHPVLMLEAASEYLTYVQVPPEHRETVIAGRRVSALFAASAVAALGLAGFVAHRWSGLLVTGPLMATLPPLLLYAHYLKEDTALIFGIALTVLGAAGVTCAKWSAARLLWALVLGVGAGCAASGKYVGVAALAPALLAAILAPPPVMKLRQRWKIPLAVLWHLLLPAFVASVSVFIAVWINADAFLNPWTLAIDPDIAEHIGGEYEHGTTAHNGVGLITPNLFCLRVALREVGRHTWVLFGVGLLMLLARPRVSRWGVVVLSFFTTFAVVLAHNAVPFDRYALPVTVLAGFLTACLVAAGLNRWTKKPWLAAVLALLIVAVPTVLQMRVGLAFNEQFRDDSRHRLRVWMAENLPENVQVVADNYAGLSGPGDDWRFDDPPRFGRRLRSRWMSADMGDLEQLRRRGVDYVIIAEPTYARFFEKGVNTVEGQDRRRWRRRPEVEDYRTFYQGLFDECEIVWESKPNPPSGSYVDPHITVFRVTP